MGKYADYQMPSDRTEVRLALWAARRKRLIRAILIALVVGLFLLAVYVDFKVLTCANMQAFCAI